MDTYTGYKQQLRNEFCNFLCGEVEKQTQQDRRLVG